MTEPIILIGGGGHCRACIDVIETESLYQISGIVDQKEKIGENVLGYEIIAGDDQIAEIAESYKNFFITLGQIKLSDKREQMFYFLEKLHVKLPFIVSPLAHVSNYAQIFNGSIIMHYALVNSGSVIGKNCIINSKALIEHDAEIGDHCHISTGALINGGVKVGSGSFIGSGSIIREGITIGEKSVIAAGIKIMQDVPAESRLKA